jgi:hypothetical protein
MAALAIKRNQLKDMLSRNWLTHDALWYGEVGSGPLRTDLLERPSPGWGAINRTGLKH